MLKRVIIFIFLCSFFLLRGQQINTSEIRVYESFKPSIPEPKRLNENAIFLDTIQRDKKQEYRLLDHEYYYNYKTPYLSHAVVKKDKLTNEKKK